MKICCHCKESKELLAFNKCKARKDGLHGQCRSCQKAVRRRWYLSNLEKEKEKSKAYSKTKEAKVQRIKYYSIHKDVMLLKNRKRRANDDARCKARLQRKSWLTQDTNRLACNLRVRIRKALIYGDKSSSMLNLLGCTLIELRVHLEQKFARGMTWDNYGQFGWHMDHIKCCASFDLTDPEQQKKCFHYTNLQPLWWKDNLSKGSS